MVTGRACLLVVTGCDVVFVMDFACRMTQVSREQYDLYTDIESAFETCKICDARMKSMRMEPCGHLLCKVCLQSWMEANGGRETLCPFCREKVSSKSDLYRCASGRSASFRLERLLK